jgi:hypothetical protein
MKRHFAAAITALALLGLITNAACIVRPHTHRKGQPVAHGKHKKHKGHQKHKKHKKHKKRGSGHHRGHDDNW